MSKNNAELKKIFELAVHSQKNKDLDKAKDLYEKVLETYPNDLATLNNAGTIYKELRKFSTAIEYYKKALRVNKEDLATNYNLGLLFHQLDEYNNSINFYKKVIKINPKHLKTYNNFYLGLLSYKHKEYINAIKHLIQYNINYPLFNILRHCRP